ncbi:MAG: AbrB/MazE/SpoVT family DNA-binding domain-containing protein [Candidatus Moranbacteria bacterium CG23_combo_of_CG06-09_8_20_14_all_39_10]|nr:MAG: AbrB/MazE/SpoVT family DNA-binding domain-containing protein [Candidatus Moranbacteria bacterium CG23_combo_of_CG06-09_8_20_14_all_39_10]
MTKLAKVFMNGQSQAVRLPKECRFEEDEVLVKKIGDLVILFPKKSVGQIFEDSLLDFPEDFMKDRNQPPMQKRKANTPQRS